MRRKVEFLKDTGEVTVEDDPNAPEEAKIGGPLLHSERIVKGEPESRWNDWAIGRSLLKRIEVLCQPGGWFLEFGSGVGTRRLAEKFKVLSFEHDPEWIIYSSFEPAAIGQILAPLSRGWYHRGIVRQTLEDAAAQNVRISGCLIDGPPSMIGREGILQNLDWLAPYLDCPIFVDDTHREPELVIAEEIAKKLRRTCLSYNYTDADKAGCAYAIIQALD